jgi:hypothetical protein
MCGSNSWKNWRMSRSSSATALRLVQLRNILADQEQDPAELACPPQNAAVFAGASRQVHNAAATLAAGAGFVQQPPAPASRSMSGNNIWFQFRPCNSFAV